MRLVGSSPTAASRHLCLYRWRLRMTMKAVLGADVRSALSRAPLDGQRIAIACVSGRRTPCVSSLRYTARSDGVSACTALTRRSRADRLLDHRPTRTASRPVARPRCVAAPSSVAGSRSRRSSGCIAMYKCFTGAQARDVFELCSRTTLRIVSSPRKSSQTHVSKCRKSHILELTSLIGKNGPLPPPDLRSQRVPMGLRLA